MRENQLYFIALMPHSILSEKIISIKNDFAAKYHCKHSLKLPPHITIQPPFRRLPSGEDELQLNLQKFFSSVKPFEIKLNGFGCFDKMQSRVIFIQVEENRELNEMRCKLISWLRTELNFSERETPDAFHPHITLAHRDLSAEGFKKAWQEYKDKPFAESFYGSSAHLLKHNSQKWEVQGEFAFGENL